MGIHFGVDYYPEHWPKSRWETDVKLMKEMGVQVVRLAEFSWFKMEPNEGEFHFEWLEDAISLLDSYGIKAVLGTPTAAPPAWIIDKNPKIQPIDYQGRMRHFGGRHHDCQSNPVYRSHIKRFVTAMMAVVYICTSSGVTMASQVDDGANAGESTEVDGNVGSEEV